MLVTYKISLIFPNSEIPTVDGHAVWDLLPLEASFDDFQIEKGCVHIYLTGPLPQFTTFEEVFQQTTDTLNPFKDLDFMSLYKNVPPYQVKFNLISVTDDSI